MCAPFPRSFVTSLEKEQSEYLLAAARQRRAERTQRFLEATPGSGPGGPGPNGRPRRAVSSRELNSGSNDAYEQLRSEIQRRASARRNSARGLPTDPDGDSPVAAEPEEPASARSSDGVGRLGPERAKTFGSFSGLTPAADADDPDGDNGGGLPDRSPATGMRDALRWLVSREEEVETAEEDEAASMPVQPSSPQHAAWSAAPQSAEEDASSPSPSSPIGPAGVTNAMERAMNGAANLARQLSFTRKGRQLSFTKKGARQRQAELFKAEQAAGPAAELANGGGKPTRTAPVSAPAEAWAPAPGSPHNSLWL